MNKKIKGYLSILFMSLMFYMMIDTKYVRSLGDYIVEFVGLKSWTGNQSGTHLTVFYFSVLFFIGLFLVRNYAMRDLKLKGITIIIIFIGLNTIFSLATGEIAKSIKANAGGLLSIELEQGQNSMEYEIDDGKYTKFSANITLKNYSEEDKEFYLRIDEDFGYGNIKLYNLDGKEKMIILNGKETKVLSINLNNTMVNNNMVENFENAGGSGIIERVIIYNKSGEEVRLESKNFLGIVLQE